MISLEEVQVLHLEPTTICNAGCPQCSRYLDDGTYNQEVLPSSLGLEDIKSYLPRLFIRRLKKMFMCGTFGEPAAAQDTLEIFTYFREVNPTITLGMNTNGSVRNSWWWKSLAQCFDQALDYVVFSIDGLEDTNHIYRKNTQWSKIINNAESFIAAGGSAHWDMLVFDHNKHQIDQARQLAKDMGFKWFRTKLTNRFLTRPINWLKPVNNYTSVQPGDKIICKTQQDKEVYLSAHGLLLPCCYIGEELYAPNVLQRRQNLLDHLGDPQNYHISHGTVVDHFDQISQTWSSTPIKLCQEKCSNINNQPQWKSQWVSEEQLQ